MSDPFIALLETVFGPSTAEPDAARDIEPVLARFDAALHTEPWIALLNRLAPFTATLTRREREWHGRYMAKFARLTSVASIEAHQNFTAIVFFGAWFMAVAKRAIDTDPRLAADLEAWWLGIVADGAPV